MRQNVNANNIKCRQNVQLLCDKTLNFRFDVGYRATPAGGKEI